MAKRSFILLLLDIYSWLAKGKNMNFLKKIFGKTKKNNECNELEKHKKETIDESMVDVKNNGIESHKSPKPKSAGKNTLDENVKEYDYTENNNKSPSLDNKGSSITPVQKHIRGRNVLVYSDFVTFSQSAIDKRDVAFSLNQIGYGVAMQKLFKYMEKHAPDKTFIGAVSKGALVCENCLYDFPFSAQVQAMDSDIAPSCPQCGSKDALYVYSNPAANDITIQDIRILKAFSRYYAEAWWNKNQWPEVQCTCGKKIIRYKGFHLFGSDITCDSCVQKLWGSDDIFFKKMVDDQDWLGTGMIDKAREWSKTHKKDFQRFYAELYPQEESIEEDNMKNQKIRSPEEILGIEKVISKFDGIVSENDIKIRFNLLEKNISNLFSRADQIPDVIPEKYLAKCKKIFEDNKYDTLENLLECEIYSRPKHYGYKDDNQKMYFVVSPMPWTKDEAIINFTESSDEPPFGYIKVFTNLINDRPSVELTNFFQVLICLGGGMFELHVCMARMNSQIPKDGYEFTLYPSDLLNSEERRLAGV